MRFDRKKWECKQANMKTKQQPTRQAYRIPSQQVARSKFITSDVVEHSAGGSDVLILLWFQYVSVPFCFKLSFLKHPSRRFSFFCLNDPTCNTCDSVTSGTELLTSLRVVAVSFRLLGNCKHPTHFCKLQRPHCQGLGQLSQNIRFGK
jgi:hypothetical protein